jgi:hypothetical protein
MVDEETDYVVDEDATAHAKHVECCIHKGKIRVFGFAGGPYDVENASEMLALLREKGLSSTTYVNLLVPQIRNTPTFPIAMSESNSRFDRGKIHEWQMRILRVFKKNLVVFAQFILLTVMVMRGCAYSNCECCSIMRCRGKCIWTLLTI